MVTSKAVAKAVSTAALTAVALGKQPVELKGCLLVDEMAGRRVLMLVEMTVSSKVSCLAVLWVC